MEFVICGVLLVGAITLFFVCHRMSKYDHFLQDREMELKKKLLKKSD